MDLLLDTFFDTIILWRMKRPIFNDFNLFDTIVLIGSKQMSSNSVSSFLWLISHHQSAMNKSIPPSNVEELLPEVAFE